MRGLQNHLIWIYTPQLIMKTMFKNSAIFLGAALLWVGCGDDSSGGTAVPDATPMMDGATADATPMDAGSELDDNMRRMVLASTGRHVVVATYDRFQTSAGELLAAVMAWQSGPSASTLEAAQMAWQSAMAIWQQAEVMQFGPAAAMEAATGGQDMRDDIYSWPTISRCRVDQEVVEAAYSDVTAFTMEGVNVRGLDALESLLFNQSAENTCSSGSTINRSGSWAAIPEAEIQARRADYAVTLATLVRDSANRLQSAWAPAGENFLGELEMAGAGSEVYSSGQEGLNALSDALFYLDKETKDMKLAIPAALTMDCMAMSCPEDVESDVAHVSLENIRQNLVGFQAVFTGRLAGTEGPETGGESFRSLLLSMGADSLVSDMDTAIANALAAVGPLDGTLAEAVVSDRDDVVALYNAVKSITDILKTSFVGTLDLELPARAEGDND